jgi:phospholipase/lecithinase/hemolysin
MGADSVKSAFAFATVVVAASSAAHAALFTSMVNFGDSLSDVGNVYNTTTALNGLGVPTIPGAPGYYQGRFSNGPIWLDQLAPKLGLGAPVASTAGGSDYAYGDATTATGTSNQGVVQNIGNQVAGYVGTHVATSSQLFTILGGANDISAYLSGTGTTTPTAAADNIAGYVSTLYGDGARNVMVVNLPDLGKTPELYGTAGQTPGTLATQAFNAELAVDLTNLQQADPSLHLYGVDLYDAFNAVIASPSTYGFGDVHDAAYTGDPSYLGTGTAVANPSGYLFWDELHPTTGGHAVLANLAAAAVPEPSSLAALAVVGLSLVRRKR